MLEKHACASSRHARPRLDPGTGIMGGGPDSVVFRRRLKQRHAAVTVASLTSDGIAPPAPDLQQTVAKLLASRIRAVMSSTGRLDGRRDAGFIGSFGTPFAWRFVTASTASLARFCRGRRMRSWPAPRCARSNGRDERMCEPHASINYFAPGRDRVRGPCVCEGPFWEVSSVQEGDRHAARSHRLLSRSVGRQQERLT